MCYIQWIITTLLSCDCMFMFQMTVGMLQKRPARKHQEQSTSYSVLVVVSVYSQWEVSWCVSELTCYSSNSHSHSYSRPSCGQVDLSLRLDLGLPCCCSERCETPDHQAVFLPASLPTVVIYTFLFIHRRGRGIKVYIHTHRARRKLIIISRTESETFLSVLWRRWLGDRKGARPVKTRCCVCWRWQFDWSFTRLIIAPVVTTTSITLLR